MSRSSSQEQEQSSGPKHLSPSASVPLLWPPTPSGPPRGPPTCMYSLADARTCQCDQFTLETLTKIKFQVHHPRRSLFLSEAYSTRICHPEKRTSERERDRPNGYNSIENVADTTFRGSGCYQFGYASGIRVFEISGA